MHGCHAMNFRCNFAPVSDSTCLKAGYECEQDMELSSDGQGIYQHQMFGVHTTSHSILRYQCFLLPCQSSECWDTDKLVLPFELDFQNNSESCNFHII